MDKHVNNSGFLDVGDGHKVYWEDWGNKTKKAIIHLHGGPGTGFDDSHKLIYDPKMHHVIFADQRGCGKSIPFGNTDHNTTQDLINDIEKLRQHLHVSEKTYIAGGSWGSALALLYAIAHPENVEKMLLWSIYTLRNAENDAIMEGYTKYIFPEAWERFIRLVPADKRGNSMSTMMHYFEKMRSSNPSESRRYAIEWSLWEYSLVSLTYDIKVLEHAVSSDPNMLAVALLESHYFTHRCFVTENIVYENLARIRHIPCVAVQGRFDLCTLPYSAYDLSKAYGENFRLQWVNSGHLRTEPEMMKTLQTNAIAELF